MADIILNNEERIQKILSEALTYQENKSHIWENNTYTFTLYEDLLIIVCRSSGLQFKDIVKVFENNPNCCKRSLSSIKNHYAGLKIKFGNVIYDPIKYFDAAKTRINKYIETREKKQKSLNAINNMLGISNMNTNVLQSANRIDKNLDAGNCNELLIETEEDNDSTSTNEVASIDSELMSILSVDELYLLNKILISKYNKTTELYTSNNGLFQFSCYENILLLMLKRHEVEYSHIHNIFQNSPHCKNRTVEALKSRYKKIMRKLGSIIHSEWDAVIAHLYPKIAVNDEVMLYTDTDFIPNISNAGIKDNEAVNETDNFNGIDISRQVVLNYIDAAPDRNDQSGISIKSKFSNYELAYLYFAVKAGAHADEIAQAFRQNNKCHTKTTEEVSDVLKQCKEEKWLTAKNIIKQALRDMQDKIICDDEKETAQNADCESHTTTYPTSYVRNVDYGEPKGIKSGSHEFPLGAILADRINMSDSLTQAKYMQKKYFATVQSLFSILKRNNTARMNKAVRIPELAFFWRCSAEEATERIDTFIARGLPITRDEDLVRLIHEIDNTKGGIPLKDITAPVNDLGSGASVVRLGVLSDTHYGSPMCEEALIERFYEIAYEAGVRTFVHAGDLFDGEGVYKGQDFEITCKGFDKNLLNVAEIYPKYPDVVTYAIVGNHDHSYITRTGANPIFHLAALRDDIKYLGVYQANLRINNEFVVNLHHGAAGCTRMAPEAYLRRIINDKQEFLQRLGAEKYDLCVLGHFHIDAEVETPFCRKGIFGGGWQNTTAFTRRLNLPPYIGGYIVNMYKLPDEHHHITVEKISFNSDNIY